MNPARSPQRAALKDCLEPQQMPMSLNRPLTDPSPLVSVILPVFNCERYFHESIDSVFAQSYENWELLIVDDGSTDKSPQIALEFLHQHPRRVLYLHHDGHQNRGTSATRNLGILHARGKYVAFLDADDVWFPTKLERQVTILESHPDLGMVYGRGLWWYSWTGDLQDVDRDFLQPLGVAPNAAVRPAYLLTTFLENEDRVPSPSGVLLRTDTVKEIGAFEESFPGLYDDQVLYAKVALQASVFVSGELWYRHRQHPDSLCATAIRRGAYWSARVSFLRWLEEHLDRHDPAVPDIREVLGQELERARRETTALNAGTRLRHASLNALRQAARTVLPAPLRAWLRRRDRRLRLRLRSLKRLQPIRPDFGHRSGQSIDRYYIESFLARHASDIRGHVLEVSNNTYTRRFGGSAVIRSDVLHVIHGAPRATIIADLTRADHIPSEAFDCIILTQTLQFIFDIRAAIGTLHRILKPGGVLLATFPGISQIARYDMEEWGEYWRLTTLSATKLFAEVFPEGRLVVQAYGNVLTATAFLHGLVSEELRRDELEYHDRDYELLIGLKAQKAG